MQFPFSLVAAAFAFSAGVVVAGIFYFIIMAAGKKSVSASKISIFIAALAVIVAVVCLYLVFLKDVKFPFNFMSKLDWIYLCVLFILGAAFFVFTAICLVTLLPAYLIFSFMAFLSLWSLYPRKKFFEYKQATADSNKVTIICYEMNPYVLLPGPRIWYKMAGDEEKVINPFFSFFDKTLLTGEKTVVVELPDEEYYPVIYKINVNCSAVNLQIKAEPVL